MTIKKIEKKKIFPRGTIVLQTIAMPAHINANGNIFGGWIMSQMDIGGGILAKEISGGRVVTGCVSNIVFLHSISIGDLVSCYAKCLSIGKSSLTISIEIWIKKMCAIKTGQFYCTSEALFIYVAVDNNGKSRKLLPMSIL
ncbi:acyl-CoA thioester hydrolase YciA [Buchnera aphidicola (Formosaphis micheliae)]|uniref:acyl-CoA thioester hydrolase YciA n=1 Tax=Buchnera aphidicola TaxID=9 RepID=UPI0031B8137F